MSRYDKILVALGLVLSVLWCAILLGAFATLITRAIIAALSIQ